MSKEEKHAWIKRMQKRGHITKRVMNFLIEAQELGLTITYETTGVIPESMMIKPFYKNQFVLRGELYKDMKKNE